jgi:hypothetical protein
MGPTGATGAQGNTGSTGATGPTGPAGTPGGAIKTFTGNATLPNNCCSAGTAVAGGTFTVPSSGVVYASGMGYCNVAAPVNVRFSIETASSGMSYNLNHLTIVDYNSSYQSQLSFHIARAFNVGAGAHSLYMNGATAYGTASTNCYGHLTVMFFPSTLP